MANKINYHITLDELLSPLKRAKSGIHIKPENKGKFSATKKRTGETTEELTHSKSAVTRKRAIFAQNAAKWHHADDGDLIPIEREHPNADTIHPGNIDPNTMPQGVVSSMDEDSKTPDPKKPWYKGVGTPVLAGLTALDALIPNGRIKRERVIAPSKAYDPNPYGTGSQAIMDYGGYVEQPKRFGYFKDEASNKLTFKKGGSIDGDNLLVFKGGGFMPGKTQFPSADGIDAYNLQVLRDGGEVDNRVVWADGGNIQPAAFPGNPHPMASRSASYPKGQAYKSKWIAPDGATVPGIPRAKRSNQLEATQVDLNHQVNTYDLLQRVIGQGGNPLNTDYGKTLRKQQDGISGKLVQAATIFNQRDDMLQKSPQERMEAFTNLQGHDPDVQAYIARMKNAVGSNLESPDPTVNGTTTNGQAMTMASKAIASFDQGGVMQAGQQGVDFHYGGGAKTISYNPYGGPTMQFQGPSHEEGGIGMSYGGKKVEVEGDETGFVNREGDFNVMGNMKVPGTNKKFKQVSKDIARKENSAMNKADKGSQLMANGDESDSYDYLVFNSGRAITIGSDMKLKKLATAKEQLAGVQKTILDTADRLGVEPNDLAAGKYTKAKMGTYMRKAADGDSLDQSVEDPGKPSVAKRHNNPGNLKYAAWMKKYGAVPGDESTDGGRFAKFPDVSSGLSAMNGLLKGSTYNNLSVEDAIKKWTGGKSYSVPLGELKGKKIKDLDQAGIDKLTGVITQGEDSGYYDPDSKTVKYSGGKSAIASTATVPDIASGQNMIQFNPSGIPTPKGTTYDQAQPDLTPLPDIDTSSTPIQSSTRFNKLNPDQLLGEAYGAASNHVEPVPMQEYHPQLYSPYQVSFQDRINDNQETFTELAKRADYNPAALASLGAQKYSADNSVRAEEFRTNQGISQDIANKNVSILNDAQLKNLQMADTQMVRQATARSKTKAQTQAILNSVSSKILQNDLENKRIATYEPLFDYRYQDTNNDGSPDTLGYEGGPAHFNFSGSPLPGAGGSNNDARNKIIRDKNGNIKETQQTFKPQSEEEMAQLRLMMQKRKAYRPPSK